MSQLLINQPSLINAGIFAFCLSSMPSFTSQQPSDPPTAPVGSFAPEPAWVKPALDTVESILQNNPPVYPPTPERLEALSVLDGPLHLKDAGNFESVNEFLLKRLTRIVAEIEETRVTTGVRIWKIYNHGFVVRTPSVTLGFDVVRGWQPLGPGTFQFGLTPDLTARLAAQLDILTVSHVHGDHADQTMMEAVVASGAPVLADPSVFTTTQPTPLLIRPPRLSVEVATDPTTAPAFQEHKSRKGHSIRYIVYPGHQAPSTTNNVYLLRTPEDLTFMHTGDQAWAADTKWIENVARHYPVDVLMPNTWASDLDTMVKGSRAKLVIMGHENEMLHTPERRETFWRSFQCFRSLPRQPYYILCWGEGVHFFPSPRTQ